MIIPAIKTEGVFTFSTPFDKEDINNKYYTVIAVRMLKDLFKNEEDPLNSIYLANGLTEDDFNRDLEDDVPVVSLSGQGTRQVYVPANKISGMPRLSGVKYRKKMININLGLIPEEYPLTAIIGNLEDVIKDSLGRIPTSKVSVHSTSFLKTEDEHNDFMNFLATHPRAKNFKSYKQKYLELNEQYIKLKQTHDELSKFMNATWNNNVNFITRIPGNVQQVMTKKIILDGVSGSVSKSCSLSNLRFKIASPIGGTRTEVYAKGFSLKDVTGKTAYYSLIGNVRATISVKEGVIMSSHLPDIFSMNSKMTFFPFTKQVADATVKTSRFTIEIVLEEPMYISDIGANLYHGVDDHLSKFRVVLHNESDSIVFNTTYELNRDFSTVNGVIEKDIKDSLQIRSDIPHPLPDPVD